MREVQIHTLEYVVVDVPATLWKQHRFRAWLVFDGHGGLWEELANLIRLRNVGGDKYLRRDWELHVISYVQV